MKMMLKLIPDPYISNGVLVCRRYSHGDLNRMIFAARDPMVVARMERAATFGPTWSIWKGGSAGECLAVAGLVPMADGLQLWSSTGNLSKREWVFARTCVREILSGLPGDSLYAVAHPGQTGAQSFLSGLGFKTMPPLWEAEDDTKWLKYKRAA